MYKRNSASNHKMTSLNQSNGWQEGKTLKECMLKMLEDEIMCDVTFVLGNDSVKMKAHKYMLASRSPVFYTMFEGSCPETGDVIVPDIDAETFKLILRYIYSDELEITIDNLEQVLYAATKYMLEAVKMESRTFIQNNVNSQNSVRLLQVAMTFEMGELRTKCQDYLINNTLECIQEPLSVDVSKDCVEIILKLDKVNCHETDLWKYFLGWLSHQCKLKGQEDTGENMRVLAGDLLYLIHFPDLNKDYFAKQVTELGVLSSDEIVDVFKSHYDTASKYFINEKRQQKRKELEIVRYGEISQQWGVYVDDRCDAVAFVSNKPIHLTGVIMYGPTTTIEEKKAEIKLRILKNDSSEIYQQVFYSKLDPCELQIFKLKTPINLSESIHYSIVTSSPKFTSFYGRQCRDECSVDTIKVTFLLSKHSKTDTNISLGQIAGITFDAHL